MLNNQTLHAMFFIQRVHVVNMPPANLFLYFAMFELLISILRYFVTHLKVIFYPWLGPKSVFTRGSETRDPRLQKYHNFAAT